jgi:hypothetical protein
MTYVVMLNFECSMVNGKQKAEREEKMRLALWGLISRLRGFINHLRLPGGIGKAGSKAAFHWVSW